MTETVWIPHEEARAYLGELPEHVTVEVFDGLGDPPEGLEQVTFWTPPLGIGHLPDRLMPSMPKLEILQLLTAGYDFIDLDAFPKGVILSNVGGIHDIACSEWVVAATLAVLRNFPKLVLDQTAGVVERDTARDLHSDSSINSDTLDEKTVLLLGYGGIGRAVEKRMAGFDVEFIRVARTARDDIHAIDELDELLPRADIVVLLLPINEQTTGLVDTDFLARMPDGAVFVNGSRGLIVDQDALVRELRSGRLRAALDAATPDPLPAGHPLLETPGLFYTPHIAGATNLTFPRLYRFLAAQLRRYLAGDPLDCLIVEGRRT